MKLGTRRYGHQKCTHRVKQTWSKILLELADGWDYAVSQAPMHENLLAYTALPLTIILGIEILKFKAYKIVPWFSIYVLVGNLTNFGRFFVRHHYYLYFYVYWYTDLALMLLEFVVLWEVYRYVFRNSAKIWWIPVSVLVAAILVGIRIEIVPLAVPSPFAARILIAEMVLQLLEGFTFIVLVISLPFFHLHWKRYPIGIITGIGFYALVSLVITSKISVFVTNFNTYGWIEIIAYIITDLIWVWFFRKPQESDPRLPEISVYDALAEIQKYRRILKRFRER